MAVAPGKPLSPTFLPAGGAAAVPNDWTRMMLGDGSWTITDPNSLGSESNYAFTENAATTSITIDKSQTDNTNTQSSTRNGRRWLRTIPHPSIGGTTLKWSQAWGFQMLIIIDSRPGLTDDIYLMVGLSEDLTGNYRAVQSGLFFDGGAGPELKTNKSGDSNGYVYGSPNNDNQMSYGQISHHPYQYCRGIIASSGLADGSARVSSHHTSVADEFSGGSVTTVGVGFWIGSETSSGSGTGVVTFRAYYKFDVPASGYGPTS